jgi:hypothetical protein
MENEILNRIDTLALKLNVASDKLYEVLIKQSEVELYSMVIQYGLIIGLILVTIHLSNKFKRSFDDGNNITIIKLILLWFGSSIGLILGFDNVDEFLTLLINPEYWALNNIIRG